MPHSASDSTLCTGFLKLPVPAASGIFAPSRAPVAAAAMPRSSGRCDGAPSWNPLEQSRLQFGEDVAPLDNLTRKAPTEDEVMLDQVCICTLIVMLRASAEGVPAAMYRP